MTDPTFEAAGYEYLAGSQVICKIISPALSTSDLGPVDTVLFRHDQHSDNLDPAGRALLSLAKRTLTTPAGAARLGGNAEAIGPWQTVTLTDTHGLPMRVTAIPTRHGPAEIERATGEVTGWLLEWGNEPGHMLYISGDLVPFQGLEEGARRFPINFALLHFGAAQAERFGPVSITLTASEGAHIAALLGDAIIIPIHYEGWTHRRKDARKSSKPF